MVEQEQKIVPRPNPDAFQIYLDLDEAMQRRGFNLELKSFDLDSTPNRLNFVVSGNKLFRSQDLSVILGEKSWDIISDGSLLRSFILSSMDLTGLSVLTQGKETSVNF